jgi:hypothetical protein
VNRDCQGNAKAATRRAITCFRESLTWGMHAARSRELAGWTNRLRPHGSDQNSDLMRCGGRRGVQITLRCLKGLHVGPILALEDILV